ncbi:MAG TPA: multidrug efflux RND transporter permease subunit, partial [Mucilaginibacter sp.]
MSKFFVGRPIVAIVISIFLVIGGLLVLSGIPISQYPDITPPMIKITGAYGGANALDVEQAVATPIEQQINGVENMLYMQSVNANDGSTTIQVAFEVGTDLDKANMLTQNRVAMANPTLPAEVRNIGISTKKALSFPLALVSLYSPNGTYSREFINNYNYIHLVDRIKRIKGVGDVNVFGGTEYAIRVWLKPDRMASLGITVNDVRSAMSDFNAIAPGGSFGNTPALPGTQNTYTAQLQGRLVSPEEFGKIILKSNSNGGQVLLSDIARIELGAENYAVTSRFNGKNASTLSIYQVPGSNALEVAEAVRKTMSELQTQFPADLSYKFSLDTTLPVHAGIEEIIITLLEAMLLVIIVVFIFLQDWRATLIPLITVPVSLIATFLFFPLLGFSVNVLSLLGMVLAIGLVVDDSIVVIEAVVHHIEQGLSPKEATLKAMKEVATPVITIAVVLSAVFIPVALTGGITGRLYQQFAITIAISVLISAFNALTLTPALAAMILRPKKQGTKKQARFFIVFNRIFEKFTNGYVRVAGFFARKLLISVMTLVLIICGAALFSKSVPTGFVPQEDDGYFLMAVMLPDAASFERTDIVSHKAEHLLEHIDGIQSVTSINGYNLFSGTVSPNSATMFVQLKDWKKRPEKLKDIINKVNGMGLKYITEATVFAVQPPPIPGLGGSAGFTLELQDQAGKSPLFLAQQARKFITEAQKRPEIGNIYTLFRPAVPQKSIHIDKEKLQKLGLSLNDVNGSVSALLGGAFINNFNQFGRQYKTYIQADASYRMNPGDLQQFFVRDRKGDMIPLSTLVTVTDTTGPLYTNRFNLFRSAEISGSPAPGYSSAQAMKALEEVASQTLSTGMGYQWSNMSYQEKAAEGKGSYVFVMALVFVFLILAAQYESWKLPFSVLLGTPWAVMGAMMGLYLCHLFSDSYQNNVFAQIGLVMLIGLNAKNAILIVEFAKMRMEDGASVVEAAIEGARLRFRPILMTSLAFILGVVPLVTASGAGAEARKVMGMAVFSGMITATVLGCILIPSFFVLIQKKRNNKLTNPSLPDNTY